jgi:uncharacterized protein
MKCPACQEADLVMSERQGIEIDYCPRCRGVWLDRGELDKIIERSDRFDGRRQGNIESVSPPYYQGKPHKHKSFWHELFD